MSYSVLPAEACLRYKESLKIRHINRIHQDRTLAAAQPIEKSTAQIEQDISHRNAQQIQQQQEQVQREGPKR